VCGIAGYIDLQSNAGSQFDLSIVASHMRNCLSHRGPHADGLYVDSDAHIALSHRRLSVIDPTPAGAQPMTLRDQGCTLVYNGEIYNAADLAATLPKRGSFKGYCDTEVLLHLLAARSSEVIPDINGMFAFAFYDSKQRDLMLARDKFGQKPLYYSFAEDGSWFAFASELHAILAAPRFKAEVDQRSLSEYLLLQYVHAPRSILKGVYKLPPGSILRVHWDHERVQVGKPAAYYQWNPIENTNANIKQNITNDQVCELGVLLDNAVERRLVSDVPLGAMLSSGIDSTLITESMVRQVSGGDVQTFSIGFDNSIESEHCGARDTAALLGTQHYDEVIKPDIRSLLFTIAKHLDEPLGDSGCLPMWCLSNLIKDRVTVVLTGDGGDEMFGGYQRYADMIQEQSSKLWQIKHRIKTGIKWEAGNAYCSQRWWMLMPDAIDELMQEQMQTNTLDTARWMRSIAGNSTTPLIHKMRTLDAWTYMPGAVLAKVDRMTMAFGVEARSPFLDPAITSFAENVSPDACITSTHTLKPLLRRLLQMRLDDAGVKLSSNRLVARPKMGFGLPSGGWNQHDMITLCHELLLSSDTQSTAMLDADALRNWVAIQDNSQQFSVFQVWTMLIFELWLRELSQKIDRIRRGQGIVC